VGVRLVEKCKRSRVVRALGMTKQANKRERKAKKERKEARVTARKRTKQRALDDTPLDTTILLKG